MAKNCGNEQQRINFDFGIHYLQYSVFSEIVWINQIKACCASFDPFVSTWCLSGSVSFDSTVSFVGSLFVSGKVKHSIQATIAATANIEYGNRGWMRIWNYQKRHEKKLLWNNRTCNINEKSRHIFFWWLHCYFQRDDFTLKELQNDSFSGVFNSTYLTPL